MEQTINTVCPSCGGVNRIIQQKLEQGPTCGKCQGPLILGKPVELDGARLQRFLEKGEMPLLVDFWAPWCGPCRAMAPAFEQAAATLAPNVILAKVNTQDNPDVGQRFGINSIPTMMLFKPGREPARVSGAMSAQNIVQWAQSQG